MKNSVCLKCLLFSMGTVFGVFTLHDGAALPVGLNALRLQREE